MVIRSLLLSYIAMYVGGEECGIYETSTVFFSFYFNAVKVNAAAISQVFWQQLRIDSRNIHSAYPVLDCTEGCVYF